jgi:hypothetical protein
MRCRLGLIALSIAAAACSTPLTPVSPELSATQGLRPQSWLSPGLLKTQHLLYVASEPFVNPDAPGSVAVYALGRHTPKLIHMITKGIDSPRNPCLGGDGTLYVPNQDNATVAVYPFGQLSPSVVLSADLEAPAGCAVDASNNLWVADFPEGKVFEFVKGRNRIGVAIDVPCPASVAFDATGSMYVGVLGYDVFGVCSPAAIEVFAPGKSSPFKTITSGLSKLTTLEDIAIGPDGTLYAADAVYHDIVVYPPGRSQYSKKLTNKITAVNALAASSGGELYAGNNFSLGKHDNHYIVVEFAHGSSHSRRLIANRLRLADGLHAMTGLAAWPK